MNTIENNVNNKSKLPDFNDKFSLEDKINVFANLIVDRIISDMKNGIIHQYEEPLCKNNQFKKQLITVKIQRIISNYL